VSDHGGFGKTFKKGMVQEGKIFADRKEAGFEVGKLLENKYKNKNALVLGIPRGGIAVAYEVAKVLNAELSVVITKKLPHPLHEEFAIGAAAEDGSVFLTSSARNLNNTTVQRIVKSQSEEIKSRIQRFRKGKPLPEMTRRIVIIADDGIATGATIVPAIKLCKNRNAARIIVAAPVSGADYVAEVNSLTDDVVIAERPDDFYAVGQVYDDFHSLSDEEVISFLEDFEKIKSR
jgi:putative phosphoribosyl transferase